MVSDYENLAVIFTILFLDSNIYYLLLLISFFQQSKNYINRSEREIMCFHWELFCFVLVRESCLCFSLFDSKPYCVLCNRPWLWPTVTFLEESSRFVSILSSRSPFQFHWSMPNTKRTQNLFTLSSFVHFLVSCDPLAWLNN